MKEFKPLGHPIITYIKFYKEFQNPSTSTLKPTWLLVVVVYLSFLPNHHIEHPGANPEMSLKKKEKE